MVDDLGQVENERERLFRIFVYDNHSVFYSSLLQTCFEKGNGGRQSLLIVGFGLPVEFALCERNVWLPARRIVVRQRQMNDGHSAANRLFFPLSIKHKPPNNTASLQLITF